MWTVIEEVTATPVAPLFGEVFMTDGGVVSEFGGCVIKLPGYLISEMLAQSLIEFPFTVIFTYRPVVSGKSYLSKPVVVPLLLPEKTVVNDLPSIETEITKLLVLCIFPLSP